MISFRRVPVSLVCAVLAGLCWTSGALAASDQPLVQPRTAEALPALVVGALLIVLVLACGLWYAYRSQKLLERVQAEGKARVDVVEPIVVSPDEDAKRRRIAKTMVVLYLVALVAVNPPVLAIANKPILVLGLPLLWLWCYLWYAITIVSLVAGTLRILNIEGGL